jgi:Fur family ferric uptake transcriptional regulator
MKLIDSLETRGIRLTAQRRILVEAIDNSAEHLDAAALLERARERDPRINRATVYRTLDMLKRQGLIDELDLMHLNGEKHYYEPRNRRNHAHLACLECGRIEEYSSETYELLKQEIRERSGFTTDVVRLEVGGRCRACSERKHG